ncbi:MAG: hypothetical protein R2778_18755 [Saprospiraceae bacterium]
MKSAVITNGFLMHGNLAQSIAEKSGLIELPPGKYCWMGAWYIPFPWLQGSIGIRADEDGHEIALLYPARRSC